MSGIRHWVKNIFAQNLACNLHVILSKPFFLEVILSRTVELAVPPNGQSQTVTSCQPCRIDSPITKLYIAKVKYMYILSSTKKLLVNV